MAEVIWTAPALIQLDEIAEYIAFENPDAASKLVATVFDKVSRLEQFPNSGRKPPELPETVYREVVVSPCRIFYRRSSSHVFILHVMREERKLRAYLLGSQAEGRWR